MSYGLNSLKGVIKGVVSGTAIGGIQRDTRNLHYSSHSPPRVLLEKNLFDSCILFLGRLQHTTRCHGELGASKKKGLFFSGPYNEDYSSSSAPTQLLWYVRIYRDRIT